MRWIIYCVERKETGQKYVGQTHRGLKQKQKEHLIQAERGKLKRFHAALCIHGNEQFTWSILVDNIVDQETANNLEREWIIRLNSHISCDGYNLTWGGHGTIGYRHNTIARKKIGDRFRGIPKSEEQRRKMGEAISKARKGKKYGPRKFTDPIQAHKNMSHAQRRWRRKIGWPVMKHVLS